MEPELERGHSGGPLIVDQPNFIETHTSLAQQHRLTSLEPEQIQEVSFDDLLAPSNSTYFRFTFPSPFCYNTIIQYISNT
jgi:hypothetical protein